ncbi:hypothetical protein [Saccharibacillus deserti]|uniref:hypothetical protein n=1 Tax=Saccharibacillus deserti TaxID=1634444 RepID=UPI001556EC2C|nr:hypothetical protein [Saccharibacillus deserti]
MENQTANHLSKSNMNIPPALLPNPLPPSSPAGPQSGAAQESGSASETSSESPSGEAVPTETAE